MQNLDSGQFLLNYPRQLIHVSEKYGGILSYYFPYFERCESLKRKLPYLETIHFETDIDQAGKNQILRYFY